MKNIIYYLFVALVFVTNASAQVNYKAATDVDYSNSVYHGNKQDWKIEGMSHNETYTIIYIDITITSNGSGAILGQYCGGTVEIRKLLLKVLLLNIITSRPKPA